MAISVGYFPPNLGVLSNGGKLNVYTYHPRCWVGLRNYLTLYLGHYRHKIIPYTMTTNECYYQP